MALAAVLGVLAAGCGSRLTDDEIAVYAGQAAGDDDGTVAGSVSQQLDGQADETTAMAGTTATASEVDDVAAETTGGAGDAEASPGDGRGKGTGAGATGGGDGSRDDGARTPDEAGQAPAADTRAAPPGGNGGATDVGVTADSITIFNVADLTGAVPGLFQDAKEATQAYVAYFTATEGTVYGRSLKFVSRDTQLSSNGNRAAYLDACDQAFAAVGSMSAFEEGAVEPIEGCGIPDLRNIRTSKALQGSRFSFGADALRTGEVPLSEWSYYKEQFPDAITNAGYVYLENQTTTYGTTQNRQATEKIGYRWNANIPVSVAETNYARVVNELKSKDIQLVAFQGAYQQAARLASAMVQQDYAPQVFALQANNYTPDLIETCGQACEDFVSVAQTGALLEEIDSNPELQTYAEWLARINPRARPTGLGMYSWSAAKLFVESLKAIGPEPTRAKLLEHLGTVTGYEGGGLIPPQDVASQQPTDCIIILDIDEGQFVRVEPGDGYRCRPAPGKV